MTGTSAPANDGGVRQPALTPAELTSDQRELYDAITGGPRSGGAFALTDEAGALQGPFGGFLLAPSLGDAVQRLGAAVRYQSSLTDRVRELAILAVAGYHSSPFERYAHEAVGRAAGLTEQEMASAAVGDGERLADPVEAAALCITWAILQGDVADELWAQCVPPLDASVIYELIVLVGYYSMLAVQMRILRTEGIPGS